MTDTKIGVQLTPMEIQMLHRALTHYIIKGQDEVPYADVQIQLIKELADVFKRIIVMEEM
jgi:hypothetical protein